MQIEQAAVHIVPISARLLTDQCKLLHFQKPFDVAVGDTLLGAQMGN